MANIITAPTLEKCPFCNNDVEYFHLSANKIIIRCTNEECHMSYGTSQRWGSVIEAAGHWNKRPGGLFFDKYEDMPKWLQDLWQMDSAIARKAETYLKNIFKNNE